MPRVGQNPMKWLKAVRCPERVTASTLVYVPSLQGYWAQGLQVLQRCLESMRSETKVPFDLFVFDNGSCEAVQAYLLEQHKAGLIQYLVLSQHNIGKVGAWNFIFGAAPGELIAYCDSDVLFLKNWLEESMQIAEAFPEAGMITAQPIAGFDLTDQWTAQAAMQSASVQVDTGILIPDEYLWALVKSLGRGEEEYRLRQFERKDVRLTRNGVSSYATASHFQFLTRKEVVKKLFPAKATVPLGDDLQFDREMKSLGFWRLSTTSYLVHHMGNRLPNVPEELPWTALPVQAPVATNPPRQPRCIQNQLLRSMLKTINVMSYKWLYGGE